MELNALQAELERRYDVSTPHRVEDFVLHDPQLAAVLTQDVHVSPAAEQLLVAQDQDALDVSLFLDGSVLQRLRADSPETSLHPGNLQDFLFVLEGVSHFLYLVWNAGHGRPITQLELELVAEVDKYIGTAFRLTQQGVRLDLRRLWQRLFEDVRYRDDLDAPTRERYVQANRLAARYCRCLGELLESDHTAPALLRELRRFYRMPQPEKIRHIQRS